jgi:tripartite ATP-independent transporter DctP family solute receptor
MRNWRVSFLLAAAIVLAGPIRAGAADTFDMAISFNGPIDDVWGKPAQAFAAAVAKRTEGRVRIAVSPLMQAGGGSNESAIQMISTGQLAFTFQTPPVLSSYDKRFNALALPFVYTNREQAYRVLDSALGKEMGNYLANQGILIPAWGDHGWRQLTNSVRPVEHPADMRGLKIRVPESQLMLRAFTSLGAQPVVMGFNDALTAFRTGAVQGQENPLSIVQSAKVYESQHFLTLWNYILEPTGVLMSKVVLDRLPADLQKIVLEEVQRLGSDMRVAAQRSDETTADRLKAEGMQISNLTPQQVAEFHAAMQPVYAYAAGEIGGDIMKRVQEIAGDAPR